MARPCTDDGGSPPATAVRARTTRWASAGLRLVLTGTSVLVVPFGVAAVLGQPAACEALRLRWYWFVCLGVTGLLVVRATRMLLAATRSGLGGWSMAALLLALFFFAGYSALPMVAGELWLARQRVSEELRFIALGVSWRPPPPGSAARPYPGTLMWTASEGDTLLVNQGK